MYLISNLLEPRIKFVSPVSVGTTQLRRLVNQSQQAKSRRAASFPAYMVMASCALSAETRMRMEALWNLSQEILLKHSHHGHAKYAKTKGFETC